MNRSPIVVGVDGSAASATALRWGVAEGERLSLPVEAVFAVPEDQRDGAAVAPTALLTALVHAAVPTTRRLRQPLSQRVLHGEPASVLTEQSRRACFLVLGRRRGRDPLRTSTMARCLRNAVCPVAVVPANVPEPGVPMDEAPCAQAYEDVGDWSIGDVMTPNVPGVDTTASVDVALRLMVGAGVHHVAVLDQDRCVGLLAEVDVVWRLASWRAGEPPTAGELARECPALIPADHTVREAAVQLLRSSDDVVLVTDQGRIVGLLTADVVAALLTDEALEVRDAVRTPAAQSSLEGNDRDAR